MTEVNLPVKRLYDLKTRRLKDVTKLPKEFELNDGEVLFKVKLTGVNYARDFRLFEYQADNNQFLPNNTVPGNKFMGRICFSNDTNLDLLLDGTKYVIYPYTNCIQQRCDIVCKNCSCLDCLPCYNSFEIGYNLHGGLQEYLKIKNCSDILIPIPPNVSSHDATLAMDYMLPFYCFIQNYTFQKSDNVLVVINEIYELNDIVMVLKLLNIDESVVQIAPLNDLPRVNKNYFNYVLTFNTDPLTLKFCFESIVSRGLESTKNRYKMVFFSQHLPPIDFLEYETDDKTIIQYKLHWYQKKEYEALLKLMAEFNDGKRHWLYYEKDAELSTSRINRILLAGYTTRVCYTTQSKSVSSLVNIVK